MIEITLRLRSHDNYKFWVVGVGEAHMMNNETFEVTKELPQVELDRYNDRIFEKITMKESRSKLHVVKPRD